MTFRPQHRSQFFRIVDGKRGAPWGTPFDNSNCWASATSCAIEFATEGKVQWTPAQVRSKKTSDPKRGPGYIDPDIYDALNAAGLVNLSAHPTSRAAGYYRPSAIPWATFVTTYLPRADFAFIIAGDYDHRAR
jgi:hypothetical protein